MQKSAVYFILLFLCVFSAKAQPPTAEAGPYQKICPYTSTPLPLGGSPTASGGVQPYTYQWQPSNAVSNPTIANPTITTTVNTTFTVTVTGANGENRKDTVSVFFYTSYGINAGNDTTIKGGSTITLHGNVSGPAVQVNWMPSDHNIYNQNTLNPNVFPNVTTTYTFTAVYPGGCIIYDYVTITVIPSNELFFFNTFTPNADGANDFFTIGNIEKYPDNVLEIYNRYGQKVFNKVGYTGDWDGKYLNNELPAGTYFYILDTKTETGGKYHGQVTIIR